MPVIQETFDVISGTMHYLLDGKEGVLKPGEKVQIAPGRPHTCAYFSLTILYSRCWGDVLIVQHAWQSGAMEKMDKISKS